MASHKKAVLVLKDGTVIYGKGFGATTTRAAELVFNTTMTGYQETLTDPSYAGQHLIMTYPLMGNYGSDTTHEWNTAISWFEGRRIHAEGFIVREISGFAEHRDATTSLDGFLKEYGVPGMYGIDTRYVVRHIRNTGVMPAVLATYEESIDVKKLLDELTFKYESVNFVEKVTTQKPFFFAPPDKTKKTVVLIDYGVKMNIARELAVRGLNVVIVPSFSTIHDIKSYEPNGIVLSNGPGDPSLLADAHRTIRELASRNYPLFGICLGNQLLAHAFGGTTFKLKFGHRGANHAVLNKITGKTAITTQNHGYAVSESALPGDFEATHIHVNDRTIEGIRHVSKPIMAVQFHPEASPGPQDSKYLFDDFIKMLL